MDALSAVTMSSQYVYAIQSYMSYKIDHRIYKRMNETICAMFNVEPFLDIDTNEVTMTSGTPRHHVEDALTVVVPKPKKSKRVCNRGVTKQGFMVDDESSSHPKDSCLVHHHN